MMERIARTWPAKISSWLLFAAVAGAPLPFGSDDPAAIAAWSVVLGLVLVLAPFHRLGKGRLTLLALAFGVVAAYALVLHEQLSDRPWLAVASPHPVWREAADVLGAPIAPSVSIARHQPYFALGAPLVAMLALVGAFLVCVDRTRARELVMVIAWSGAAYALYGILSHVFDPTRILWRDKEAYLSAVTGTFINRNTAATYFGSCAVVWLLLLAERVRALLPRGEIVWREAAERVLAEPPRAVVVAFGMLFACVSAMFMTGSRGGVVLSLVALVVAFTTFFRRDLGRRKRLVASVLAGAAVALVLLQIMGAGTSARFDLQGAADEGRLATYRSTLRMIADHPWFGTGQGTFAQAFPAYRSAEVSLWGVWDIAHNTLLEIAADMGLPIAGLVVLGWAVMFGVLIHGVRMRHRDLVVPVSALAVAGLAALHSLIDFSLQIPGYAIVAMALIGAGLAQSFSSRDGAREAPVPGLTVNG